MIAKFEPTGPSDRLVILSCHHDSNFAFPIVNRFGSGFGIFMAVVVLSSALLTLLTFLRVLFSLEDRTEHLDDNLLFDSYRLCVAFLKHIDGESSGDRHRSPTDGHQKQ